MTYRRGLQLIAILIGNIGVAASYDFITKPWVFIAAGFFIALAYAGGEAVGASRQRVACLTHAMNGRKGPLPRA